MGAGSVDAVACVKWVDLHPEIDAVTGRPTIRHSSSGFAAADLAACEVALALADRGGGDAALVCVGHPEAAGPLAELAASGFGAAVLVETASELPSSQVGAAVAAVTADLGARWVVCGVASLDRGSATVPGFVAAHLGIAHASDLTELIVGGPGDVPTARRRLPAGRRERLELRGPAVVSVEAPVATLRRAPLASVLTWSASDVVRRTPVSASPAELAVHVHPPRPLRPRAKVVSAPAAGTPLGRIGELVGIGSERTPPRTVDAAPAEAAAEIVAQLEAWGYLGG